jgi:hypothetical protein
MTVVIDVGCARHGGDYSIERLIEEYDPHELYGFDPTLDVSTWPTPMPDRPVMCLRTVAAWTYDGEVGFRADGLNSWVTELRGAPKVPCVDLARVVREVAIPDHLDVILKLDAEGSEYDLLRHLMATETDRLLTLAVVEWHEPDRGRALIEEQFAAPIKEWPY